MKKVVTIKLPSGSLVLEAYEKDEDGFPKEFLEVYDWLRGFTIGISKGILYMDYLHSKGILIEDYLQLYLEAYVFLKEKFPIEFEKCSEYLISPKQILNKSTQICIEEIKNAINKKIELEKLFKEKK